MAINKTLADAYFGETSHPAHSVWTGFTDNERIGAIVHAQRVLARYLRGTVDTTTTTDAHFPRHDVAVYEQALWSLRNSALIRDGREEAAFPSPDDPEERNGIPEASESLLAPEALRWIVRGGVVRFGRG